MNNFWSKFSSRKDLSGHSLMNLETDSERSLLKFKEEKKHLSKVLDLSKFNNLLDLGGGIGIWSDFFLKNDLNDASPFIFLSFNLSNGINFIFT